MKKLLSVPPGLVNDFYRVSGLPQDEYFVSCDPIGKKLGSGGGTINLLEEAAKGENLESWLPKEPRIIIHAGGQSRRLPAYAPVGKILTPIPVFRWTRGQRIDQTLLSLQLPLYERIMEMTGDRQHTLICSGDVLNTTPRPVPKFNTQADVVCFGIGTKPDVAQNHGVFLCDRHNPAKLDFMLQKPNPQRLAELSKSHFFLIDIGAWLLSDKAVMQLAGKYHSKDSYDLYGEFGCALGEHPSVPDNALSDLSVEIVPLEQGCFYHFGTTSDLIGSTVRLQNIVTDSREMLHWTSKPHPAIFTQNSIIQFPITSDNEYTWIENCRLGTGFHISHHNVITGVPNEDLSVTLQPEQCLDIVPIGEKAFAVRVYGFYDKMAGDIQFEPMYGIAENESQLQSVIDWSLCHTGHAPTHTISADGISNQANLIRLNAQRQILMKECLLALESNNEQSIFYQLDLHHASRILREENVACNINAIGEDAPLSKRISNAMLLEELGRIDMKGKAYEIMREHLVSKVLAKPVSPKLNVACDQIVWSRSPVRIDLAGGWTDTPPYCLMYGGNVINMAIELNSQPPLQVYVKPSKEYTVTIRSIDLGVSETFNTSDQLLSYATVGSAFSIPKAALALAGFGRRNLTDELRNFGSGIEITLLSAIPSGSGLGTSSILASTVLAALSDFAGLGWDKSEICNRTLILEQMLTTGGGWQDQYGGVLHGIKRLSTTSGTNQTPEVRWLPDDLFTNPEYQSCHLLYYTGMRRTAKHILDEIVRGMFLQRSEHLGILEKMGENADMLYDALLRGSMEDYGRCLRRTWALNKELDSGTSPQAIEHLTQLIDDLCLGYKLPGAGGGGYLYMVAKDNEAALRIRQILESNKPNAMARFVQLTLSRSGLQTTRS